MADSWLSLFQDLANAGNETLLMVAVSTLFAIVGGIPLGFALFVPKQWALDYPQSCFLLQQEVEAWSRTEVPFKLQIR